jgi:hypothetical protein
MMKTMVASSHRVMSESTTRRAMKRITDAVPSWTPIDSAREPRGGSLA